MDDLLALDACRSRTAQISWRARMQSVTTPLCWQAWDQCLPFGQSCLAVHCDGELIPEPFPMNDVAIEHWYI